MQTEVEGPRPKRLKIAVACELCRARKKKCDGSRPVCNQCHKKRTPCVYRPEPSGSESTGVSGSGPTPRLVEPSRTPGPGPGPSVDRDPTWHRPLLSGHAPPSLPPPQLPPPPPPTGSYHYPPRNPSSSTPAPPSRSTNPHEDAPDDSEPPRGYVHGVWAGEVHAAWDSRLGIPPGKRGASLTPFKDAPLFDLRLDEDLPPGAGASSNTDNNSSSHQGEEGTAFATALPPRHEADYLVGLYWSHIQPLEPFLDEHAFRGRYDVLFTNPNTTKLGGNRGISPSTEDRIFLATLNIVFALATQLQETIPARERDRVGGMYFRRAWGLFFMCGQDLLLFATEAVGVETVQCLLMMGRYLQCSSNPHRTWMVVGAAVRMAQSMGLDRGDLKEKGSGVSGTGGSGSKSGSGSGSGKGFRRRLWQLCVFADRQVSWMTGRASAVYLPTTHPHLAHQTSDPHDDPSSDRYMCLTMKLYDIWNLISLSFHSFRVGPGSSGVPARSAPPPVSRFEEHLNNVSRFDVALERWEREFTAEMGYVPRERGGGNGGDRVLHTQAVLLRMRTLHARLTLFRPMLARHCLLRPPEPTPDGNASEKPLGGTLRSRIVEESAALCVENAQILLRLLVDECCPRPPSTTGSNPSNPGSYTSRDANRASTTADGDHRHVDIPWWQRVLYLHVAGIVLLAAALHHQHQQQTPSASVSSLPTLSADTIALVIHACRAHAHLTPFSGQCLVMFEALADREGSQRQQQQKPQEERQQQHQHQQPYQQQQQPHQEKHHQEPQERPHRTFYDPVTTIVTTAPAPPSTPVAHGPLPYPSPQPHLHGYPLPPPPPPPFPGASGSGSYYHPAHNNTPTESQASPYPHPHSILSHNTPSLASTPNPASFTSPPSSHLTPHSHTHSNPTTNPSPNLHTTNPATTHPSPYPDTHLSAPTHTNTSSSTPQPPNMTPPLNIDITLSPLPLLHDILLPDLMSEPGVDITGGEGEAGMALFGGNGNGNGEELSPWLWGYGVMGMGGGVGAAW
ncbi:hypothetical protein B0J18DRAFT_430600 [Chaetomium sp. MPI-SDFR-AT-0129]|nr:hypothetical protein B0J18DRAFT_430600 [Chaetomium sp. MPI-SDFR-AT-0129]